MTIVVPKGWKTSTLGECCQIISGGTPKRNVPEYWDGDIPWVTPKDISGLDEPDFGETPEFITRQGLKKSSAALLPAGAVLMSSRAPIGLLAIATKPMATNQGFKSFIPGPEIDSRFLYHALKRLVPYIQDRGSGATFKEVSKSVVSEITIAFPKELKDQRHIAAMLDKADSIRRKRELALIKAEELLRTTFSEMFEQDRWCSAPLSKVVSKGTIVTYGIVQAGPEYPNGVPYIRTGDIKGGAIQLEDLRQTSPEIAAKFERSKVRAGEIVMSIRATVGTTAVVPPELDGANLTQGTARISPGDKVTLEYLLNYLRSGRCQNWIQQQVKGATFREITLTRLRELEVPLPPIGLQKKFSQIAMAVGGMVSRLDKDRTESEELFACLAKRAFRGEL